MVQFSRPLKLVLAVSACVVPALAGQVQLSNLQLPPSAAVTQATVKEMFVDSYNAYRTYAWGHDDLLPVSASFTDGRNGWGASIVDGMATMYIMGLDDFFNEALNFTQFINFNESQVVETVSIFETSIRYVGGLLSAYELSGKQHQILVDKAKEVADKMAYAWQTLPNQTIPFGEIWFSDNTAVVDTSNIAEAGTLDIEWSRLSLYTGNDTYTKLTEGSVRTIANLVTPLPGLAPQGIDPSSNTFVGDYLTWGGGSDSYFEYLIKYPRVTNTDDNLFADTWHAAVDSSISAMARKSTVGNYTYIADWDEGELIHVGSHLECFHGGNWIFGGHLLNNQTIIDYGLELVDACWNTYASTSTGIGPEVFYFLANDQWNGNGVPSKDELTFYNEHGFWITASDYILRPEVLESNFYAWRSTGDTKYLDRAASAVESLKKYLPQPSGGYAGLNDVDNPSAGFIDDQESFWFAEVLKYLYLTFDDPEHISLNDYVLNTEGQPFEAPAAKDVYGSGQPAIVLGQFVSKTGLPLPAISPNKYLPSPLPTPTSS
ncbi:seven-hairpin glycosidase [Lentinula edodes]|nr:seven-hairpin glycosidase [Lentinula edodes]